MQINKTAKTILLQLLVEPDQSSMVYQFPMINQALCIVEMLEHECHGWLRLKLRVEVVLRVEAPCDLRLKLRVEVVIMKYKLVYTRL